MPQNVSAAAAAENPTNAMVEDLHAVIAAQFPEPKPGAGGQDSQQTGLDIGISSAFLQLAYPWLKTSGSSVLLESLEPPDGVLTGMLARNALTRGTYTSTTKIVPAEVFDVSTALPAQETAVSATPLVWGDNSFKPLIERISLFSFTPGGIRLLSDVTAYAGESYRPGRIHRLVAVILRESRRLGEQIAFDSNGPLLWSRVRSSLRQLMTTLWQRNALDGDTISDAFTIQCDRSTMTQNDLDNGRLVAMVSFNAASTIELIRVTLALETSGTSSQNIAALAEVG
jgi:phage tail sheath protein FI